VLVPEVIAVTQALELVHTDSNDGASSKKEIKNELKKSLVHSPCTPKHLPAACGMCYPRKGGYFLAHHGSST
jgi:hypothetical protein